MTKPNEEIETLIQAKGLTAPRVTPADIEAQISSEWYFTAENGVMGDLAERLYDPEHWKSHVAPEALGLLTFCVLVLKNGFTVTGESACASPDNFDPEIGRKIARQNAVEKIWPLEGYVLRNKLSEGK